MNRIHLVSAAFAASFAVTSLVSWAPRAAASDDFGDSAVRYAEKADEIRRRADDLRAAGRFDAADRVELRARNVEDRGAEMKAKAAERAELRERVEVLKHSLLQAKGEDRHADAQAARRELQELSRSLKVVRPSADEFAPRAVDAELVRQADELRAQARALRENGVSADAAAFEDKAARVERTLELRRASNDLGRMAVDALAMGAVGDARELAAASGTLWRESQGSLVTPLPATRRAPVAQPLAEPLPSDVASAAAGLRIAARDLREAGKFDDAAKSADRAAALERSAARLRDAERGELVLARVTSVERLRADFAKDLEESRKRIAEAEEEIRKLRGTK